MQSTTTSERPFVATEVRTLAEREVAVVARRFPALVPDCRTDQGTTTLVAWNGPVPTGHVQVRWAGSVHKHVKAALGGVPEIRRLRVHPDARGAGVARALLELAQDLAAGRGMLALGLAVGADNEAALGLYASNGYVDAGFEPFISNRGLTEDGEHYRHTVVYLVKELESAAHELAV